MVLVHAVPKPETNKLRMVVDQSVGKFSLNSMIECDDISGVKLNGICSLGASLCHFKMENPTDPLIIWKSDVSTAYSRLPLHPTFQIKQVVTVNGVHHIDRCNNFGGQAAQKLWHSFICLMVWIAIYDRRLHWLKCYVDDNFSFG
jgi:hypothetical protein